MRHNKNSRPSKQQSDTRQRFREILSVLSKYEIVKGLTPIKLRLIVEELGPTYVKLGQIMSMRRDMLPAKYCEELAKLRTSVHPMEFEEVRAVIEGEYGTELDKTFSEFDPRALGSASIAQVHAATLRADGSRVAVKVQRPGIRAMMARDIKLMRKLAKLVKMAGGVTNVLDFNAILDEMWFVSQQEMDFLIEAKQAEEFHERNKEILYTASPAVRQELTTSKVLVMEYIDGTQIDDLNTLRELGYDLREIGMKLADSYV
ncbi:MAG: AarF/UbiB family protein, partial [Massilioclostridium sp.]|nr:AarF/UbiB family protein [Massilioclostridium sp.]